MPGVSGFTVVPQLFCYENVLIVFFAVSNTSSSTVRCTHHERFSRLHLAADLSIDLGWSRQTEQAKMVALQSMLPISSKTSTTEAASVIKAERDQEQIRLGSKYKNAY